MKHLIIPLILVLFISCNQKPMQQFTYPETRKADQIDDYFETPVADPYHWLEDDNSEETKAWVKDQNQVTNAYLSGISFRDAIKQRFTELWDYPKYSAPFKRGGLWFMSKNDGLQNQSVIYRLANHTDLEGTIFLDPNTLSEDGTVSLTNFTVSDDGKFVAYGISRGGSDWREIYVMEVESGKLLEDHIEWAKFTGISWYGDGFFYTRYPKPEAGDELKGVNTHSKIYYHRVGTSQADDELIYEDTSHPEWGFSAGVTDDNQILIISVTESTSGNALYFKDLTQKNGPVHKVVESFDYDYSVVEHYDGHLLVLTNQNAPMYRLIKINTQAYQQENWMNVIPEETNVLKSVGVLNNKLIAYYMIDAHDVVKMHDMQGKFLGDIDLPLIGSVGGLSGKLEDTFTYYTITSFTTPSSIYYYDAETNQSSLFRESAIQFDTEAYETKQVFYTSKDGTKVPMFIVHKKGIELNGQNPTLLYGYGGFNISLTPNFSMRPLVWLEQGGVYAVANLRGGGEYGEEWHKAGTKLQKQNVFDDFIAAAEYLIENQYTNSNLLAINGGSNGGLLVGAVTNQRPDLFRVAIPAVGVMDMLKYHKFTIGRYWATDYGTSEESEEMFHYLLGYSPVHNVKPEVDYPAILVMTADHDDRVVPAHSFKYIAELQSKYKGESPVMIRIETEAGHGAGTPTSKSIEEYADIFAFIFHNMGVEPQF